MREETCLKTIIVILIALNKIVLDFASRAISKLTDSLIPEKLARIGS